jgi:RNA polymerase sigma-70 factor (ECF subfamily)
MSTMPREAERPDSADSLTFAGAVASRDDLRLVRALRNGDEAAFTSLLDRYHALLVRLATMYVPDRAVAEEVAQETWLGVLRGIHRFEGRSSLKTWIFSILIHCAKTRGQREGRSIPFSTLWDPDTEPAEPAVEPERFRPLGDQWAHGWVFFPQSWDDIPEERFLSRETRSVVQQAIERLPPSQREVITLRDMEGWTAGEVCNTLGISETNQRVLLHRARSSVRRALEHYLKV